MRTFAELLTEYMARTGISDSELARTLGVRRQTIFRWKEGLVDKPRYRDDVLRCAERLRLTPDERDALLLSAGFPPESLQSAPSVPSAPQTEPEAQTEPVSRIDPEGAAASKASQANRASARPWRRRAAVALVAFVVLVSGSIVFLMVRQGIGQAYPVASLGETLVLIGAFGSIPSPNAKSTGYNVTERIKAALEREIQGARLDRMRVTAWPDAIRDENTVESVKRRAGASIAIGGTQSRDDILVTFSTSLMGSRKDDLALDALVSAPSPVQMRITSTSAEEVQLLALLAVSHLHVERGDFGRARASLTLALARPPADQGALAVLHSYLGYVHQISRPPDLEQAIGSYDAALGQSEMPVIYLNRGLAYVRLNEPVRWQADLARVLDLQPNNAHARLSLCWAYALDKQPELALPHCDAAVSESPGGRSREARGVVYAQLGRLSDAAAELQSFLEWLERQPEVLRARYGMTRSEWVQKLKAGRNPIDQAALERLRVE